jgi:outer membrane protein TolC
VTLGEAVRMTLSRQPEILLAQYQTAKAAEVLREARSANLPQATAGTGMAYNNGFPLSIEGAAPSIFQFSLSQSIFSKKNGSLIRESEAGSAALQANADEVRNTVIARTILVYNELYQAGAAMPFLQQQKEAAEKEVRLLETLLEAGRVRSVDVSMKKIEVAGFEQQLLVTGERIRTASAELRVLTGIPESQTLATARPELTSELLSLPIDLLYKRTLEIHPALSEAEATIRARASHLEAEKAEAYPQFTIISQYALFSRTNNYQDFFNKFTRNNYVLGLSVQVPLFNGSRTSSRVAQSRKDLEIAQLQLQRLKEDLKLNLEKASSAVRIAGGALGLARLEAAAFEQKLKVAESQMEAGRIEPGELAEVRVQRLEKQSALVEAERVLLERQVELLQVSGALNSVFQ